MNNDIYMQPQLLDILKKNNILDPEAVLIPWHSDQIIQIDPDTGRIEHVIYDNEMNGINITDQFMNNQVSTMESDFGSMILDGQFQHLSTIWNSIDVSIPNFNYGIEDSLASVDSLEVLDLQQIDLFNEEMIRNVFSLFDLL